MVACIRERDPDVIEGHNIFGFDLPYLAARAKMHSIRLELGRDGSEMIVQPAAELRHRLLLHSVRARAHPRQASNRHTARRCSATMSQREAFRVTRSSPVCNASGHCRDRPRAHSRRQNRLRVAIQPRASEEIRAAGRSRDQVSRRAGLPVGFLPHADGARTPMPARRPPARERRSTRSLSASISGRAWRFPSLAPPSHCPAATPKCAQPG